VDFVELVRTVTEAWRPQMAKKEISLEVQLPLTELHVYGDADRLKWALDNLLSNAHNYTAVGGHIQVNVSQRPNIVCLEVTDNGTGIAKADQPYIFDRFFRAKNEINYAERGIGLGLFITRTLLTLHDGRISVNSQVGVGSTFHCELPLAILEIGD
jgi:two-component system sensor histidine kinase ResE